MTEAVTAHYSFGGLRARIEAGIAELGGQPTVAMLGAVDEFHVGGRPATQHLVGQLDLTSDDHVLDIGSGLGGLARYIASTTGARVTGVDLTAEYVEVATWLTELVGLDDMASFVHGSAADLPAQSFTAATMVHVGMNIADKSTVFTSLIDGLAAGSRFAIYDLLAVSDAQPEYPCPWAATAATSFLETAADYVRHLETAGFRVETVNDRSEFALSALTQVTQAAADGPAPLGLHLVMGPTTPTKVANLRDAVRSGVLAPTELIAIAP